jgi:hypothetical protein
VLKSRGAVVLYTTFATDLMEPSEKARVFGPLGIVPESVYPSAVEEAFSAAGLVIQAREVLGSVMMELMEEGEGRASKYLLRIARMMRARERYLVELGEEWYQTSCALYHWGVYLLLGKLSASLYTLKKGPS